MNTKRFHVTDAADPRLQEAGAILRRGGLVAIPTETVYGLAANALDETAVKAIFAAKGRPVDNPLIVHIANRAQWSALVKTIPPEAERLAAAFWPGPLTIILKKSEKIPAVVSGGLDTVAVRMPSHIIARAIITEAGVPLAAPSANLSGKPSPTNADRVQEDLDGKIDLIIDAGDCSVGVESTVVSLAGKTPRLLRPGGVTPAMLEDVLGKIEIDPAVFDRLAEGETAASPGMKYKHYAPRAKVILLKGTAAQYRAFLQAHKDENAVALCFAEEAEASPLPAICYGSAENSLSQASRIFEALRQVDESGAEIAYAHFPPAEGLGLAVFNRLVRAAAFRILEL